MPTMRRSLVKSANRVKKSLTKTQKNLHKKLSKRLRFVGVWRRALTGRLRVAGRAIERRSPNWLKAVARFIARPFRLLARRIRVLLRRRPHRSFRMTRRRDYKRSLSMPGYWAFTNYVRTTLMSRWRLFGGILLVYFFITIIIGGLGAQESYQNLSSTLKDAGSEIFEGNWGQVQQAGLLLATTVTAGLTPNVTQAQSVLGGLAVLYAWLATVWAMRTHLAGHRAKVRDALYSSGSPVLSTAIVAGVLLVQLLPASLAVLLYNAAAVSGLLEGGVEAMMFWVGAALLVLLSLYWIISTVIALVVVTIPGMYPFEAIRAAGDLVVGRRLRVLYRILWLVVITIATWALVVIPVILFDDWAKGFAPQIAWIPLVPMVIILMSSLTVVYAASYVYLLYRKVMDDEAKPA